MTHFTSFARVACHTGLVWLLASACGGQSTKAGNAEVGGSGSSGGSSSSSGSGTSGTPNYDACQTASDCMLDSAGCGCLCDSPDLTEHDFIAYNAQYADQARPCADGNVACNPCPPGNPMTNARKFFVPNCVRGACVVEDIRQSAVTACQTADDCRLRRGTDCCQGCGAPVVAVRSDGSFETLVCSEFIPRCEPCQAGPPPNAVALCDEGHCSAAFIVYD